MSLKTFAIGALLSVCAFTIPALAQKNELSGLIGRTFISDQGIKGSTLSDNKLHFGNGLSFEANYARRVIDHDFLSLALEVPVVVNPDEDWHAPTNPVGQYWSYFVTPAARLNVFSQQAVSPWISVGGGFGHFSVSSPNTGTTTGVFQAGLGLDVRIFGRFSLRLAARDFWSGVPQLNVDTGKSRQHNIFVAGGIVWHF